MKKCRTCGTDKELTEFHKKDTGKFGVAAHCKPCRSIAAAKYEAGRKEQRAITSKRWATENRDRKFAYDKQWVRDNPDRVKKYASKYRENNIEKERARYKRYDDANLAKRRAGCGKRRAAKINATPIWADKEAIESKYALSTFLNQYTFGVGYHVDHIVPLRGKNVCGLHVEYNLQVIRAEDNMVKSNKWN